MGGAVVPVPSKERVFTYGILMDPQTMHPIAPGAEDLGVAVLDGYRLAFTGTSAALGGGVADVVPADRAAAVEAPDGPDRVEGVLWAVPADELEALDAYEGVPEGHYERVRVPVRWRGRDVEAWAWTVVDKQAGLVPGARAVTLALRGARRHDVSKEYLAFLERVGNLAAAGRAEDD